MFGLESDNMQIYGPIKFIQVYGLAEIREEIFKEVNDEGELTPPCDGILHYRWTPKSGSADWLIQAIQDWTTTHR